MTLELKQRLHDAHKACEAILEFTRNLSYENYAESLILRSAVERQFEILGEALNKAALLSPELEVKLPDLRRIVGMRNRIIHGYDSVDDAIVWDAAQHHVPPLAEQLPALLLLCAD